MDFLTSLCHLVCRSVLPKHASDDTVFALFNSVWEGQIERVKRFIFQQPVLINAVGVKDFRGESLLHTAAKTKNEALARFLMRQEVCMAAIATSNTPGVRPASLD